jgi:tRNA nucleotidyltransferase/poly(A) polymerase
MAGRVRDPISPQRWWGLITADRLYVSSHGQDEVNPASTDGVVHFPALVDRVAELAGDQAIYLVGGAVRDALLGKPTHDFDFALDGDAIGCARLVARQLEADFYVLDERFGAARVLKENADGPMEVLDFSSFRGADLSGDLRGRDFTINAIAFDPRSNQLLDPLHGAQDLRDGLIRACSSTAFQDDAIRVLRAIRMAVALDFRIETESRGQMKAATGLLSRVSAERQRDELFKMLGGPRPDAALRAMESIGALAAILPELPALQGVVQAPPHVYDVWNHTLSAVRSLDEILGVVAFQAEPDRWNGLLAGILSGKLGRYRQQIIQHFDQPSRFERDRRSLLFFAALYHDIAKPARQYTGDDGRIHFTGHDESGATVVEERIRALKLSKAETSHIREIVRHHMRFPLLARAMEDQGTQPSKRAIYRFFRAAGTSGVELILLGLADLRGARGPFLSDQAWSAFVDTARILFDNYWGSPEQAVSPAQLLDGNDLMRTFGLDEGPVVGRVLEALREAQAEGNVSSRQDALEFCERWLEADAGSA